MFKKAAFLGLGTLAIAAITILYIFRPIAATHQALQADLPKLVALRHFYANTDSKWRYRLSPDGKYIAWLATKGFRPALWVRPLGGEEADVFNTKDEVRWYSWSADGRYLLYQANRDGWENDVIVSIDVTRKDAEPRSYDFGKNVKSWIHSVPAEAGSEILIGNNQRDARKFDLYRLNLETGKTTALDLISEIGVHWSVDRQGDVYARTVHKSQDDWRTELRQPDGTWNEIAQGGMEDWFQVLSQPDEDGNLLALSTMGRDKSAVVTFDTQSQTESVMFDDDAVDTAWVELHPVTGAALSAVSYPDFQHRKFFDPDYEAALNAVPHDAETARHRVSTTNDMSKMIIETEHTTKGWTKYLVNQSDNSVETIAVPPIAAQADHLSKMEPVTFSARDGLTIHATMTRPKGAVGPAPMVVLIHGGPVARSAWGFSSLHSWLANRGYVVLDVNYRGSGGFGRNFREAAVGEVSRKMHYDIVDARAWAVDQGFADPDKVAVLGGSFGGLKVLTAVTQSPELFAAGIDINGISDISTMLQEVPAYWQGWPDWYQKYIGDPSDPEMLAEIKDRSPLYHAAAVQAPLLIIQGSNDVRVIQDQADRMVDALTAEGK
ncbi:alpha/beta fold hydrolase, partial [Ascidiaceihabitans sp.]|uniref:S9 family peptidase n=1 Tax=Ascidiaceihabitans sp. TaxID=1872644 RepID=UPI003299B441